jgi:hypothetical protein
MPAFDNQRTRIFAGNSLFFLGGFGGVSLKSPPEEADISLEVSATALLLSMTFLSRAIVNSVVTGLKSVCLAVPNPGRNPFVM